MRPSPLRNVENAKYYVSNPSIAITAVDILTNMQYTPNILMDTEDVLRNRGYVEFADELHNIIVNKKCMKMFAKKKSYESRDYAMCRLNYLWLPSGRACIHCGDKIDLKFNSCNVCTKMK